MLFPSAAIIILSVGLIEARSVTHQHLGNNLARHASLHAQKRAASDDSLTLDSSLVQKGSTVDGSQEVGAKEVGQALSATSTNNFINNCAGKVLTNGLQILTGSCNGIPMGDIPAKTAMVSSVITFPETGTTSNIQSDSTFNITVQMINLVTGSFTNADATYYAAPQALQNGQVVGHTHVTVQDMGDSLNPTKALDPTIFGFFKGINTAADSDGVLTATVTGGLPAGNWRVCTIASASNHQAVLMPVAQRGTADDCTKFVVSGSGTTENTAANDGSGGIAAAAAAASAVAAGPGAVDEAASAATTTDAASAAATSAAQATKAGKKGGKGSKQGGNAVSAAASAAATSEAPATTSAPASTEDTGPYTNSTGTVTVNASSTTDAAAATTTAASTSTSTSGALGGIEAPAVTDSGNADRPFEVNGNTFVNESAAKQRSCDIQFNACANLFNAGQASGFTISDCQSQETTCNAS